MENENTNQEQQNEQQDQQQDEQVETVLKADYDALQLQLDEVKAKLPEEVSEKEQLLIDKEKALFEKEVAITLKGEGLQAFADVIKVDDSEQLQTVVEKLKTIVNQITIDNGYIPPDGEQSSSNLKINSKTVSQSLNNKFSKLFK